MATVQIRDVPEASYETLRRPARAEGRSIQAHMLQCVVEMTSRPTEAEHAAAIEDALVRHGSVVVDASALVAATTTASPSCQHVRARRVADDTHAPHLIDAELGDALRRLVQRGATAPGHAPALLASAPGLVDHRYGHRGRLAAASWSLREDVTFYDGLHVALAASLGTVLLTAGARSGRAPGLPCQVDVIE